MFRLPKSLVLATAGAGLFTTICGEGLACPPRGGGGYRPVYYQQAYQPRVQAYQPQTCQPTLQVHPQQPLVQGQQPGLTQQQLTQQQMLGQQFPQQTQQGPFAQQGVPGQQFGQQPVQGGQVAQQGGVQQSQFTQQGQALQGQFAQQGQVAQQRVQQTQVTQQNVQGVQQPAQGGAVNSALNALGAQGGQSQQTQQVQQQPVQQQVQAQPAQPAQPQTAQTAPSATSDAGRAASDMALEALLGTGPVAQEATPAAAIPTGDFSASISNGAQVRLSLQNDNTFQWIATKDQKQSTFSGTYNLSGSAFTLLRSDSQKLEGTLTQTAAGFQLQFAGQKDGLNFVRTSTFASR